MNSNEAEIAAGEWLARLDRDAPSPEDLAAFDRWKAADPRHMAAYTRLAAAWQALDRVQAIRPGPGESIDNDYLSAAMPHSPPELLSSREPDKYFLDESSRNAAAYGSSTAGVPQVLVKDSPGASAPPAFNVPSQRRLSHRSMLFFSFAASILVSVAGLWIAHNAVGPQIYRTSIGGFQRIVLSDQSAIDLNTDSEVRVALTPQLRRVELVRGEASFEVAHDPSRPFIVSAGNTAVRAVGTKFDVRRLDNSVEVTVDEGRVAIGAPSLLEMKVEAFPIDLPQLSAGQTATASGSGVKLRTLPKDDIARRLAWQNQMLVFDGDSLADVVAQFNRYNERQLIVSDPALAQLHIGGYFRPTNLDAFINVLQSDFEVRVQSNGGQVELTFAGKE